MSKTGPTVCGTDRLLFIDYMIYCALTNLPNQMHPFNITCLSTQLRLHRLAVHVDALLGRGPVGHVAPRGPQRRLLQVRIRGQVLQVDPRAPRHRVSNMEFMAQCFVGPSILSVLRLEGLHFEKLCSWSSQLAPRNITKFDETIFLV